MRVHCYPTSQASVSIGYASLLSTVSQPVASAAMSQPTFLSLSVSSTPRQIRLSFQWTLSETIASFWSQWRVFSGVNVWVDKGASLTPASSTVWTVCTCVHCLGVCVCPKGVCLCVYVCARLFVLYCVFTPMTWPPCSVKGSGNTMGAPPFSFLISLFFSHYMSLHRRLTHS